MLHVFVFSLCKCAVFKFVCSTRFVFIISLVISCFVLCSTWPVVFIDHMLSCRHVLCGHAVGESSHLAVCLCPV